METIAMYLKQRVSQLIAETVAELQAEGLLPVELTIAPELERPGQAEHGDFATNLAMKWAKAAKKAPRVIADAFVRKVGKYTDLLAKAEAAGPGFINLSLAPGVLMSEMDAIRAADAGYGSADWEQGKKYLLEFVSANPVGPLNIVSARAAAVGDSLGRILKSQGAEVQREYYINDAGNQARLFGKSLYARWQESQGMRLVFPDEKGVYSEPEQPGQVMHFPAEGYRGEYVAPAAVASAQLLKAQLAGATPEEACALFKYEGVRRMVALHKDVLQKFGVEFDRWYSEGSLFAEGKVKTALEDMQKRGFVFEKDGAVWFRSTDFGDDKDRVLIKANGDAAYILSDIAYHRDKFERGFTDLVDLWGPDHHGYIARMKAAIQALGHDPVSFQVHIVQQVNLLEDGKPVAMSKRAGKFIEMQELIDDIGKDVARFFFLMRSTDSHLDFDLDLARKHTDENPVFYVQYAHARISSILRKAGSEGVLLPGADQIAAGRLAPEPEETALARMLSAYPEVLDLAARTLEPHGLAFYLKDLATVFHRFYTECRVLDPDALERSRGRLALADATRIVLRNGLQLLGVDAPDTM
jgi:arginyl-tRNA synthetase